jgi:hypothetical protein
MLQKYIFQYQQFCKTNGQKGQTFVVVVVIMLIAMSVGIASSSRFLISLRSIVSSDNVTKAQGVAEAAIERLLLQSSETLTGYINNNNCGSNCTLTIIDTTGQQLTATVVLSLLGNTSDKYSLAINESESASVNLTGFPTGKTVYACWNGTTSIQGMYIYSQSGVIKATPFAYNSVLAYNTGNNFAASSANFGYANCFGTVASETPLAIRYRSLYGRTDLDVLPESGYTIPIQGIKMVSTGKAGGAVRKITVVKSNSYTPVYFDFALYQKTWDTSLSN